jgi:hypothetical protein
MTQFITTNYADAPVFFDGSPGESGFDARSVVRRSTNGMTTKSVKQAKIVKRAK